MTIKQKTFSLKAADTSHDWHLVDADGITLGRLATEVAKLLCGKQKVTFTPHVDNGDHVVVINASRINVTGRKLSDKIYYSYSGYPGGLRQKDLGTLLKNRPEDVIKLAIRGMIPKNKLADDRLKRLHVFASSEHIHAPQKPVEIKLDKAKR